MENEFSKRTENKKKNKEAILETAERLFVLQGFENTSMDDVSINSGFTKRTLYQYFLSKEDLFFGVALKAVLELVQLSIGLTIGGQNAFEKMRLTNQAICQFYQSNPAKFRLMNYLPENRDNCLKSPNYQEMKKIKDQTVYIYGELMDEGKKDGSIKRALDTEKAVFFGFFSVMGLLNLVSTMDKEFFGFSDNVKENEFLHFSLNLLAEALKA